MLLTVVFISISTLRQFLYYILHPFEILTLFLYIYIFLYLLKYIFTQVPVFAIKEHVPMFVYNR